MTKRKKPTIRDVAQLAGVAPAIASRALNSAKRPVSQDKRERVMKAAEELGYISNPLARGLATNSVELVAVVVNQLSDLSDLDLFDPLIAGLQSIGKQATIIRVGGTENIRDFLAENLSHHAASAVVFSDFADDETIRDLFATDHVLMVNGRRAKGGASITIDDTIGIKDAIDNALERGAKSAALVSGRSSSLVEQSRTQKYIDCFKEAGIDLSGVFHGDYTYASGKACGETILQTGIPDAVFATSDAMAMGIMDVFRKSDMMPPKDYLLFGYDVVRRAHFDHYDISSIGFKKAEIIELVLDFVKSPAAFQKNGNSREISARFVQRGTT